MGTIVYMRRIPTAEQKEELKRLLKKLFEEAVESIDRDEDLRPSEGEWQLADEIEKMHKRIYEEVHIGKRSWIVAQKSVSERVSALQGMQISAN